MRKKSNTAAAHTGAPPPFRSRRPIYHGGGSAYGIDSCLPQRDAVERGRIRLHGLSHGLYPGLLLAADELQGLSSIGSWSTIGPQDWGLEPHRNEGVELCFLAGGSLAFRLEGRRHLLRPGTITVTSPWQLHQLGDPHIDVSHLLWMIIDVGVRRPDQAWSWPAWVVLSRSDQGELARRLRAGQGAVLRAPQGAHRLFAALGATIERFAHDRPVSRLAILLNEVLWMLLESLRVSPEPVDDHSQLRLHTVQLFLQDVQDNDTSLGRPWQVGTMAAACGMGVTAFTALAQACTGQTPMAWLRQRRLERAARLLAGDPERSVIAIAMDCGFATSQYFATAFRRFAGCTPGEYRGRRHPRR